MSPIPWSKLQRNVYFSALACFLLKRRKMLKSWVKICFTLVFKWVVFLNQNNKLYHETGKLKINLLQPLFVFSPHLHLYLHLYLNLYLYLYLHLYLNLYLHLCLYLKRTNTHLFLVAVVLLTLINKWLNEINSLISSCRCILDLHLSL